MKNPVEMADISEAELDAMESADFNLKNAGLAAWWLECLIAGSGRSSGQNSGIFAGRMAAIIGMVFAPDMVIDEQDFQLPGRSFWAPTCTSPGAGSGQNWYIEVSA
jgi:hypothetical protein